MSKQAIMPAHAAAGARRAKSVAAICVLLSALLPDAGCAPIIVYRSDTEIKADLTCRRKVMVMGKAGKRMPNLRVKLSDYLRFPDAERYDKFVLTNEKALLQGSFKQPREIPSDFRKLTPGTQLLAGNRVFFRSVDLGLVRVMEYDEHFNDIVERASGERALQALVSELLDVLCAAIEREFDKDYDTSRLQAYLREQLPLVIKRLYARLWEIRRARRGGIDLLTESGEWKNCIVSECERLGYSLPAGETRDRHLKDLLLGFLESKLRELVTPRREGVTPPSGKMFARKADRLRLLDVLQNTVKARYGSIRRFSDKIQPLLVQTLGAFLVRQVALLPLYPRVEFQVRLVLPGHVVQTNGLRDVDGSIIWTFTDNEVALSGYGIWARSLIIDHQALAAMGIHDFPRHLYDVERLYQGLRDPRTGKLCAPVMQAINTCVARHSLAALEALVPRPNSDNHAQAPAGDRKCEAIVASRILALLAPFRHRQPVATDPAAASAPDLPPRPAPEPPPASGTKPPTPPGGAARTEPGAEPEPEG